jgi:hypothetical protein
LTNNNKFLQLPEIKLSHKHLALIKIVIVVSIFLVIAINVLANAASAYEFVYCYNEVSGLTIIYPEGTSCDVGIDEPVEEEEDEQEEDE